VAKLKFYIPLDINYWLSPIQSVSLVPDVHTHTQPFYGSMDFVWDNPGELVPQEIFTHSHLSWSSIIPYLLLPSNTIHGILLVQTLKYYNTK